MPILISSLLACFHLLDVRAYFGGYPRLVTAFRELENEAIEKGRDVLKLHAGKKVERVHWFK